MKFNILTLFPEAYLPLQSGVIGRAVKKGIIVLNIVNIRDYSLDKHKKCDDAPYGGGAGMVMTAQPLTDAVNAVDSERKSKRIYLSPKGTRLEQNKVKELAEYEELTLVCGCYEGVDQRFIDAEIDEEISVGDYILTGGELASMIIVNAVSRLKDGVLGNNETTEEESFENYLLEYPQYTKPRVYNGIEVPDILLSGNHELIKQWRLKQSVRLTRKLRPDLYRKYYKNRNKI